MRGITGHTHCPHSSSTLPARAKAAAGPARRRSSVGGGCHPPAALLCPQGHSDFPAARLLVQRRTSLSATALPVSVLDSGKGLDPQRARPLSLRKTTGAGKLLDAQWAGAARPGAGSCLRPHSLWAPQALIRGPPAHLQAAVTDTVTGHGPLCSHAGASRGRD